MSKNPAIKITLIILLVIAGFFFQLGQAVLIIHNAGKVRMLILTRNMAGGTSLVYEIDTRGISADEKNDNRFETTNRPPGYATNCVANNG
jgi:hypothetical protein